MNNFEGLNNAKEAKEIGEFIAAFFKLQAQINNPTRDGMVNALSDAQKVAAQEITSLEHSQGEVYLTPWSCIPYGVLYDKLFQYQQGLYNHAVNKFGTELVKKLIKDYGKASHNY